VVGGEGGVEISVAHRQALAMLEIEAVTEPNFYFCLLSEAQGALDPGVVHNLYREMLPERFRGHPDTGALDGFIFLL